MSEFPVEIEGVVSAVSQRANRYGVKIGDTWYGGFGSCPVERGSSVVVTFYQKDGWRNIRAIRLIDDESDLTPAEVEELQAKVRQRNFEIATESVEDAKRLLASSGVRSAVTAANVVRLAERLMERRILHLSRVLEDFLRRRRIERTRAARARLTEDDVLRAEREE